MIFDNYRWRPNLQLEKALSEGAAPAKDCPHYWCDEERKRIVEALNVNRDTIVVLALRETPSLAIAAGFGVSREAIRSRLRQLGLKPPHGNRGRTLQTIRSSLPGASRSPRCESAQAQS